MGGCGVRAIFNRSDAASIARTFFDRASAGAFWTYAREEGATYHHVGGEVDVALLGAPINGMFDPFLSLGAGVLRASVPSGVSGTRLTSSDFALTPAAGIRVPFFGGLGVRGDLRLPIVFGEKTTTNFAAEAGVHLGL